MRSPFGFTALLLSSCAFGVGPGIVVGSDTVLRGQTAVIPVSYLEYSEYGIANISAEILYSWPQLVVDTEDCGALLGDHIISCDSTGPGVISITGGVDYPAYIPSGSLGELRFTVSLTAPAGEFALTVDNEQYNRCIALKSGSPKGLCLPVTPDGTVDGSVTVLAPPNTVPALGDGGTLEFSLCPGESDSFDLDFTESGGDFDGSAECSLLFGSAFEIDPATLDVTAGTTGTIRIGTTAAEGGSLATDTLICLLDGSKDYSLELTQLSAATPSTLNIADAELSEGDDGLQAMGFHVALAAATGCPFTVAAMTQPGSADGDDFQAAAATLAFLGDEDETRAFEVLINGDRVVELDESFVVALGGVSQAYVTLADGEAIGTIRNDDMATVSVDDGSASEGGAVPNVLRFQVSLDGPVDAPVSVDFATLDGTATAAAGDYVPTMGALTFPAGAAASEPVDITLLDDAIAELDETFALRIDMLDAAGRAVNILRDEAEGTISDDDLSRLLQLPIGGLEPADRAGTSVSVHGTSVAVGVPGADGESGTVLLFDFGTGQPRLVATIPSPANALPGFGQSVSIFGELLLIGTEGVSAGKGFDPNALSAALYQRLGTGLREFAAIKASDAPGGGQVALGGDPGPGFAGTLAFVGSPIAASVTVFEVTPGGLVKFGSPLTGPPTPKGLGSHFGAAVAAGPDKFAIGAPGAFGGALTGSVALYALVGGNLESLGAVTGTAPTPGGAYGSSIALLGDTLAIGAPGGAAQTGAVELYTFPPAGLGFVTPMAQIPGPAVGGRFGSSLALDGDRLLVGAPGVAGVGAVFVYQLEDLVRTYVAPPGATAFGASVSAFEGSFAVGAPETNDASGAAFVSPATLFKSGFELEP